MHQIEIWNKRFGAENRKDCLSKDVWIANYDKYFTIKKNDTIIDLGCGRGENSQYLYNRGFSVISCDFSPVVLDKIKSVNKFIPTICFDMTREFPISKGTIGIVLASLSTHYFPLSETKILYRRIFDILNNNGYFIFRVNSLTEYDENDKDKMVSKIEDDYYLLNDGTTKRYFSTESMAALLSTFHIAQLRENSLMYYGKWKYFIEGLAQKK